LLRILLAIGRRRGRMGLRLRLALHRRRSGGAGGSLFRHEPYLRYGNTKRFTRVAAAIGNVREWVPQRKRTAHHGPRGNLRPVVGAVQQRNEVTFASAVESPRSLLHVAEVADRLRSPSRLRNSTRRILPLTVFGSSSTNSTSRGYL